jgi:hypothetical protein
VTRPLEEMAGEIGTFGAPVAAIASLVERPGWWAVPQDRSDVWLVLSDPARDRWGVWVRISKTHARRLPGEYPSLVAAHRAAKDLP